MGAFDATQKAATYIPIMNAIAMAAGRPAAVQSTDFTAVAGYIYPIDTTGKTVTLPASPAVNDRVFLYGTSSTVLSVTLSRNGSNINGAASNVTITLSVAFDLCVTYVSASVGWRVIYFNPIAASLFAAKGDILTATAASTPAVLTVGTNGYAVVADSGQSTGLKYLQIMGKESIWIPAGAMTPRSTNGAAPGLVEMGTNKNMVRTLDFDTATQEFAQFDVRMPKSWDLGTVTFIPVWSHPATVTNFGVVWGLDAIAISDNEALDVAFGTEQTSTDTGGTTNQAYQGPESSAITIAGTPAAGDLVQFRIHRDPANGSDTMAVDARLHGLLLLYTTNAMVDN